MSRLPLAVFLCERLLPEAQAALAGCRIQGLELACLPRSCTPNCGEMQALMTEAQALSTRNGGALLVGGSCLAAGRILAKGPGLHLSRRSTCFELFAPAEQVDALLARGAYLVTAGWLAGWRDVLATWKLDQASARALFAESCRYIALLDTGIHARAAVHLAEFAEFVGLPAETIPVGVDHLRASLLEEAWHAREEQSALMAARREIDLKQVRRRLAEQAALLDFVHRLSASLDEAVIVEEMLALAQGLFGPAQILWIPQGKGGWGTPSVRPPDASIGTLEAALRACGPGIHTTPSRDGLLIHMDSVDGPMGLLGLGELALPDQMSSYLETAQTLTQAVKLALGNARNLHGMIKICAWCRRVNDEKHGWMGFEQYIDHRSTASYSHGICLECSNKMLERAKRK